MTDAHCMLLMAENTCSVVLKYLEVCFSVLLSDRLAPPSERLRLCL